MQSPLLAPVSPSPAHPPGPGSPFQRPAKRARCEAPEIQMAASEQAAYPGAHEPPLAASSPAPLLHELHLHDVSLMGSATSTQGPVEPLHAPPPPSAPAASSPHSWLYRNNVRYCLWCHQFRRAKAAALRAGECEGKARKMIQALNPSLQHRIYICEFFDSDEFLLICRRRGRNAQTRPEGLIKEGCRGAFMSESARHAWNNVQQGREPKARKGSRVTLREPLLASTLMQP